MANLNVKLNPKQATTVVTYPDGSTHDINCALLLHMEGVSGGTSFVDSSLGYKTVTATNGNCSSTRLTLADDTSLNLGSSDFTIDYWLNTSVMPTGGGYQMAFSKYDAGQTNGIFIALKEVSGTIKLWTYMANGASLVSIESNAYAFSTGTWYHIAVCRSGSNWAQYINGVAAGTATSAVAVGTNTALAAIGCRNLGGTFDNYVNGYIDEFRIIKGTAAWTSAFTPPTLPYPGREEYCGGGGVDPNTVLLIHGDGTDSSTNIVDSSFITPKQVTVTGAQIKTAQSKFGGSSVLFNGTSNYLTIPDSTDWDIWGADATVDCWAYFTSFSTGAQQTIIAQQAAGLQYSLWVGNLGTQLSIQLYHGGSSRAYYYASCALSLNTWYHLAFVRAGSNCYLFLDGTSLSVTASTPWGTITDQAAALTVGNSAVDGQYFAGYIDELRISKGIARWTSGFTPPTIAYKGREDLGGVRPDPLDVLVAHFDGVNGGTSSYDSSINTKLMTTNGAGTISTAQSVFGGSSLYLTGGSGGWTVPYSSDWQIPNGDFTIDCWVYHNNASYGGTLIGQYAYNTNVASWAFYAGATVMQIFYTTTGNAATAVTLSSNAITMANGQWYHVACCQKSGVIYFFLDGKLVGSATKPSTAYLATTQLIIGADGTTGTGDPLNGYIDEMRVTKGLCRWTTSFTRPTRATGGREQIANAGKESFPGFQRIGDFTSAGTESSYSLAVNGDTDKEYMINFFNANPSNFLYFRLNNDSGGTSYGYQYLFNGSGSVSAARGVSSFLNTSQYLSESTYRLLTPMGMVKTCYNSVGSYNSGTSSGTTLHRYAATGSVWDSTANVTSLNFSLDSGNFTAGTRITVYVRRTQ
jgi:hypothetical protein